MKRQTQQVRAVKRCSIKLFFEAIPDAKAGFPRKIELEEPLRNAAQTLIDSIAYKAR